MTSRFSRFALLLALCGIVALSYVVSGFPPPPKATAGLAESSSGREGGSRTNTKSDQRPTETHAPHRSDDSTWQSASRIATTNGSSFQFGKHHIRTATLARHRVAALTGGERVRELGDASRDRSPLHSIPLLI
jgi:hypothetical protein